MGLLFTLAACLAAYPQVTGGTFSGTETDSSGAVIPAVQVAILDVATGVTRTATTDAAGIYTAPNLLAGTYESTPAPDGIGKEVRAAMTLTVGAQQVVNIRMQRGPVIEKIQ